MFAQQYDADTKARELMRNTYKIPVVIANAEMVGEYLEKLRLLERAKNDRDAWSEEFTKAVESLNRLSHNYKYTKSSAESLANSIKEQSELVTSLSIKVIKAEEKEAIAYKEVNELVLKADKD